MTIDRFYHHHCYPRLEDYPELLDQDQEGANLQNYPYGFDELSHSPGQGGSQFHFVLGPQL